MTPTEGFEKWYDSQPDTAIDTCYASAKAAWLAACAFQRERDAATAEKFCHEVTGVQKAHAERIAAAIREGG